MTNPEGLRVPKLYWENPSEPGPMRKLALSHSVTEALEQKLGREPTDEEHAAEFQNALGGLAIEVTQEQRSETIKQIEEIIQELTDYVEQLRRTNE